MRLILLLFLLSLPFASYSQECYQRFYRNGKAAFEALEFERAITQFKAAMECSDKPRNNDLAAWLERARDGYIDAIKKARDEARSNELRAEATLALRLNEDPWEAFRQAKEALSLNPANQGAENIILQSCYNRLFLLDGKLYQNFFPAQPLSTDIPPPHATLYPWNYLTEEPTVIPEYCDWGAGEQEEGNYIEWNAMFLRNEDSTRALIFQQFGNTFDQSTTRIIVRLAECRTGDVKELMKAEVTAAAELPALSEDKRLVAVSRGNDVEIWDWEKGQMTGLLSGHGGEVEKLSFSPGNRFVATLAFDNIVRIWTIDGQLLASFPYPHSADPSRPLFFNEDGTQVVIAVSDSAFLAYPWTSRSLMIYQGEFAEATTDAVVTKSQENTGNGSEHIFNIFLAGNSLPVSFPGYLIYLHAGKRKAVVSGDLLNQLGLLDLDNPEKPAVALKGAHFKGLSSDETVFFTDSAAYDWQGNLVWEFLFHVFDVSPHDLLLGIDDQGDKLIWDYQKEQITYKLEGGEIYDDGFFSTKEGAAVFMHHQYFGNVVAVWNWQEAGDSLYEFTPDGYRLIYMFSSRDGRLLFFQVSPFQDSNYSGIVLNLETKEEKHAEVLLLDMHPEENLLLFQSNAQPNLIWIGLPADQADPLRGHRDRISDAAFSSDGRRIASVSVTGELIVWDQFSRQIILRAEVPFSDDPDYFQTGFCRDDKAVFVSTLKETVILPVSTKEIMEMAEKN